MTEIRGEIEEIWKFNGQLEGKLKKFKTKDQNEKDTKIQDLNWSLSRAKLNKIESLKLISDVIEKIINRRTKMNFTRTTPFWGWLFIFFFSFSPKNYSSGLFFKAFNVSSLHQIEQNLYVNDDMTSDYTLVWFVLADWHHGGCDTTPKWPTRLTLYYNKSDSLWYPFWTDDWDSSRSN